MITTIKDIEVTRSEKFTEYTYGISESGVGVIIDILRNKLYSDKPLALIREFSCNAWDAHVQAGIENPIEVQLPTRLEPNLKIKDFGQGLTETEVAEIFCKYGASTKRMSNEYVGMLGIGSKSWAAYTDNCVVTSICGGIKTTYNAYIDETSIGKIAKLGEVGTDEASGVEISIPVKTADIDIFKEKASTFFHWWKVRPTFKGAKIEFDEMEKPTYEGKDWALFSESRHEVVAIMGQVAYKIDGGKIPNHSRELSDILNCSVVLNFKIGDLSIAANREELEYNDATIKVLNDRLLKTYNELKKIVGGLFNGCKNSWEANQTYCTLTDSVPHNILRTFANYNGKPVNGVFVDFRNNRPDGLITAREFSYNRGKVKGRNCVRDRSYKNVSLTANKEHYIFVDDAKLPINRIRKFIGTSEVKTVYLVEFLDQKGRDWFEKASNMDISELAGVSTLPFDKVIRGKRGVALKQYNEITKLDYYDIKTAPTTDLTDACYVIAKGGCRVRFEDGDANAHSCNNLNGSFENLKKLGFKQPRMLLLSPATTKFPVPSLKKVIEDFLNDYLKTYTIETGAEGIAIDYHARSNMENLAKVLPASHPITKSLIELKELEKKQKSRDAEKCELFQTFGIVLPLEKKNEALSDKFAEIKAKYPFLSNVNSYDNDSVKNLEDYVLAMDAYKK